MAHPASHTVAGAIVSRDLILRRLFWKSAPLLHPDKSAYWNVAPRAQKASYREARYRESSVYKVMR
jgi:hypothetical protein